MNRKWQIASVIVALVMILSVVAACAPETHIVKYYDDLNLVSAQNVIDGETAPNVAAPQKEGYKFVEWQLNGVKYAFDTPVTEDITLYAKYEATEQPEDPDGNNDGIDAKVREILTEMVPDAAYAVKTGTFLDNVKAVYTATKNNDVTLVIYLEKDNSFIKPLKLYAAIDSGNKVSAVKVTSAFHSANANAKPGNFGIIGSTAGTLDDDFEKVAGATVSSTTVRELTLVALNQAIAINGGSQKPEDPTPPEPDNPLIIDNGFQFNSKTGEIVDYVTSAKALLIPSQIRGVQVTTLGENLFKGDNTMETVIIPTSVTEIKFGAFQDCTKLTNVIFEQREAADAITFGINVFAGCTALEQITWPANCKALPTSAFEGCTKLTAVNNLDQVMTVGVTAFKDCVNLENVNLANCYTIGSRAFEGCTSLENMTIASTVNSIGERAFANCSSLTSFNVPASLTTLNLNVLEGCNKITTITVDPASTKYAAADNVLYTINSSKVPTSLYYVPSFVTTFVLPATITSISSTAFNACDKLTAITVEEGSQTYAAVNGVLYKINSSGVKTNLAYVPAKYAGEVTLFEGTTTIDSYALTNATEVTKIVIEEGNVNFVEIDHVIYRRASATATYFTLVTANRDYEGEVTILNGNASYTLSSITAGAFANSKITGIKYTQYSHANGVTLTKAMFSGVTDGFTIYGDAAWKTLLTGTTYSKWGQVADLAEWVKAEPAE